MNSRIVGVVGVLLALWMSIGRWPFGIMGPLSLWFVATIGFAYAALQIWLAHRLVVTKRLGKRNRRSVTVTLILSWACAIGFGFTAPESTPDGLVSLLGHWSGSAFSSEMSIALCNPLGIIAFVLVIFAIGIAYADVRERVEEDEYLDDAPQMVRHPLATPPAGE
ncbi:hypothetical protein [Leucobacter sp. gxy201]|uniref:hypothetical protein n=1 Tax=Leucobacter sp. gxy201 TaxID=2957200 RepID=UPI003DA07AF8